MHETATPENHALFVRGTIVSKSTCSESLSGLITLTDSLSVALGQRVENINYVLPKGQELDWAAASEQLKNAGQLQGGLKTFTLNYSYIDFDQNKGRNTSVFHSEDLSDALEQLYCKVSSLAQSVMSVDELDVPNAVHTSDTDFQLTPIKNNKVEITVGNLSVEIYQREDCAEVNVYAMADLAGNPLNSMIEYFE